MNTKGISSARPQKIPRGIGTGLVYAVLEWLLLSMIFVDAIFAFIITNYARYYKLQTPCLLCSRLDHVLGREKRGYYWDLICANHKLEISSLVICRAHNKLADVHQICDSCLSSFASISKSNAEKCRLLQGKLPEDHDSCSDQNPLLEGCKTSSSSMDCSCCSEPLISGGHAEQLVLSKSIVFEPTQLQDSSSYADVGSSDNDMTQTKNDRSVSFDPSSSVGYSELKVASDPDSEVFSRKNDEATVVVCETDNPMDLQVQHVQMEPLVSLPVDLSTEKLIDQASVTEPSMSKLHAQPRNSSGALPAVASVSNDNGSKELKLQQKIEGEYEPSTLPELISFDVATSSSNGTAPSVEIANESLNVPTTAIEQTYVLGSEEVCEPESVRVTGTSTSTGPQPSNLLDLGDAYKAAVENKGRQLNDAPAEHLIERDSSNLSTNFKRLLSQLSAARGLDQAMYDMMSPRLSHNGDMKPTDFSSLQKRISLERNESNLSMDGSIISIVSEVDGESVAERLRRQVEHDMKSIGLLYKELEEERNASAIAANQAMAMITKLHEEKASLNMEASQYLRMMEEQSEYDTETLQKLNDLLAEKEKEIQDLEEELEFYKRKYPNELTEGSRDGAAVLGNNIAEKELTGDESMDTVTKSLLEFEDESSYILHSLKKLEKKLLLFSNNKIPSDFKNLKEDNSEGSQNAEESTLASAVDASKENADLICGGSDLADIRNEVYDLNGRLRALEADRSFLEHAIYSVRNGEEGLQFIQEIASHLREMRKIVTNRRDQSL